MAREGSEACGQTVRQAKVANMKASFDAAWKSVILDWPPSTSNNVQFVRWLFNVGYC